MRNHNYRISGLPEHQLEIRNALQLCGIRRNIAPACASSYSLVRKSINET